MFVALVRACVLSGVGVSLRVRACVLSGVGVSLRTGSYAMPIPLIT